MRGVLIYMLLAVLAVASPASAQSPPAGLELPPPDKVSPLEPAPAGAEVTLAEAKAAQAEATELFRTDQFVQAAELLRMAYLGDPRPLLLFNAGQAYRKAERPLEARYMYEQFLAAAPDHSLALEARGYVKDMEAMEVTHQRGRQIALALEETKIREREAALALEKERLIALETQRALVQAREQLERERNKPLYRRPWFWGVMAGVSAVVVAGAVVGGIVGSRANTDGGTIVLGN